jgi:hypothetical protein
MTNSKCGSRSLAAAIFGALAALVAMCIVSRVRVGALDARYERAANQVTTWTIGAITWPLVWLALVGCDVAVHAPLALIGLVWTPVLLALDVFWANNHTEDRPQQALTYDANAISSLAFALGGILMTNIGRSFARAASPMLSACIFLICAFVIPSFGVRPNTPGAATTQAVQKVSLCFCIGLLMSAVGINLQTTIAKFGTDKGRKLAHSLLAGDAVPETDQKK